MLHIKFNRFYLILLFLLFPLTIHPNQPIQFEKVIIWGHKLHSHTHSYIHYAFFKTFKYLGYDTYWFDDNDDTNNFNFNNCLFIAEGQVDKKIPLVQSSYYILHNCINSKYKDIVAHNHGLILQVYTHDALKHHTDLQTIAQCIHYSLSGKIVYMPWATDLLPYEIENRQELVKKNWNLPKQKVVYWIGTLGRGTFGNEKEINPFKRACLANNIMFEHIGNVTPEKNINLIFRSYCAPAIQGEWQVKNGYIPCRIFKNISYGQFGITNSETVYNLFDKKIVYNSNAEQLFYDAQQKINQLQLEELLELMEFVKNKHTYVNRINTLLEVFARLN